MVGCTIQGQTSLACWKRRARGGSLMVLLILFERLTKSSDAFGAAKDIRTRTRVRVCVL